LFPWKYVPKTRARTEYHWINPPGCNDEGGDCTRMAYAAMLLVSRRYAKGTMWAQLARTLGTQAPGTGGGGVAPANPSRDSQRSGWLKGSNAGGSDRRKGWLKR
jgi:hypothetical protein